MFKFSKTISVGLEGADIKVVLVDLLCMSPIYDKYLYLALRNCGSDIDRLTFAVTAFHRDPTFFIRSGIDRTAGILDVMEHLGIRHTLLRRVLRTLEYSINLYWLGARFLLEKPDIVHIEWLPLLTHFPVEWPFIYLCKSFGIKVVYTVHNVLPHDTGNKYAKTFFRLYHTVDALICHTNASKARLRREFGVPAEKIWVIPHGAMFEDAPEIPKEKAKRIIGLEDKRNVVLFFGTIRPYKGIEFLLNAWKQVVSRLPDATLVLAGGGDPKYTAHITRRIEELGITGTVEKRFSFIPMDLLPAYHRAADILVYPYESIDQSGALLTGMSFEKPIVATYADGFKETLEDGHTGILVQYGDVYSFANAIVHLLENPAEQVRLGLAAKKQLKERYSWVQVAQKTIECYKALLQRRG